MYASRSINIPSDGYDWIAFFAFNFRIRSFLWSFQCLWASAFAAATTLWRKVDLLLERRGRNPDHMSRPSDHDAVGNIGKLPKTDQCRRRGKKRHPAYP